MNKIDAIGDQIKTLSAEELAQFREWFFEFDWALWDKQFERDAVSGKLDAMAEEALRECPGTPGRAKAGIHGKAKMTARKRTKYNHEGRYVAEVDVNLQVDAAGWSPYLTVEDACRLDDVRDALRRGDLSAAVALARVYTLEPVAASH